MAAADLGLGLIWYVVFVFSVVLHEAAHAWASLKLGDATAYRGGQVTLDPLPHIRREPIGMVVVPILLFISTGWMLGWASAPFNPFWARSFPKKAALMALAGPASNLFVLLVVVLLVRCGLALDYFQATESASLTGLFTASEGIGRTLATFLCIFFFLNLILVVFNLIPLPPLDGASVVPLFLDESRGRRYLDVIHRPMCTVLGLVAACWMFPRIFCPVRDLALTLLYP